MGEEREIKRRPVMTRTNPVLGMTLAMAIGGVYCVGIATASDPEATDLESTGGWCSNASLRGTYLFEYFAMPAGSDFHDISVGFRYFDGRGSGQLMYTTADGRSRTERFSYDVARNCTGTVAYSSGTTSEQMFVHPRGENVAWIDTRPGFVATGQDWRSSTRAPSRCSNATLKGTYSYTSAGHMGDVGNPASLFAEAGLESFDGRGRVTNRYTDSNGQEGIVTGTYRVGTNCIGRVTYVSGEDYRIYVGPTGEAFVGIDLSDDLGRKGMEHKISDQTLVIPY
jgi:hypothetical protein